MRSGVFRPEPGHLLLEDFWDLVVWAEALWEIPARDQWVQDLSMERQINTFSSLL